jgi:hypothetical protein
MYEITNQGRRGENIVLAGKPPYLSTSSLRLDDAEIRCILVFKLLAKLGSAY